MWAISGGVWLIRTTVLAGTDVYKDYDRTGELVDFMIASVCLDLILAGSELYHHFRLIYIKKTEGEEEGEQPYADGHPGVEMQQAVSTQQPYSVQQPVNGNRNSHSLGTDRINFFLTFPAEVKALGADDYV